MRPITHHFVATLLDPLTTRPILHVPAVFEYDAAEPHVVTLRLHGIGWNGIQTLDRQMLCDGMSADQRPGGMVSIWPATHDGHEVVRIGCLLDGCSGMVLLNVPRRVVHWFLYESFKQVRLGREQVGLSDDALVEFMAGAA